MHRLKELKKNISVLENQLEFVYHQIAQEKNDMFNAIVETTPSFIAIIQDEKFVFLNSTGRMLLNIMSLSDIIEKNIYDILHPTYHQTIKERIECLINKESNPPLKIKLLKTTGEYLSLEASSVPFIYNGKQAGLLVGRDITKEIIQEEKIKNAEDKLQLALDAYPVGTWEWDVVNDRLYSSSSCYTMLGYEPEEGALDKDIWNSRIHPDDRELVEKKLDILTRDFKEYSYEARILHVDGSYQWQYVSGCKIERDSEGKVTRMLGIRMDINERKLSELELYKRKQQFKTLADNLPDIIVRYDTDTKRIYVNKEYLRITGCVKDQVVGFTLGQSSCLPVDVEKQIEELLQEVMETSQLKTLDFKLSKPNEDKYLSMKAVPEFDLEGNLVSVLTISRDITETKKKQEKIIKTSEKLKEREQRFREIFENSNDNIFLLEVTDDLQFRNLDFNPAFEKSSGRKRSELIGKFQDEVLPKEVAHRRNLQYRYCVKNKEAILNKEVTLELSSGNRSYLSSIIPIFNSAGNVYRLMGIYRDITAQKHYEQQLKNSLLFIEKIIDSIPEPVFIKDNEHKFILSNEAHCKLVGFSRDKVIGKTDFDLFSEHDARTFWESEDRILAIGKETKKEDLVSDLYGQHTNIILRKAGFVGPDGNQYLVGVIHDITDLKQYQHDLELRTQALNKSSEAAFVFKMGECKFLYVNEQACKSLGYSKQELLSKTLYDIDTLYNERQIKEADQKLRKQPSFVFETVHTRKNGSIFPVECTISRYQNNEVDYIFAIARNISERKMAERALRESEQRYREVFENSNDNIYLLEVTNDMQLRNLDFNTAFEKNTGYNRYDLIGKIHGVTLSKKTLNIINEYYYRCIGEKFAILNREIELELPIGKRNYKWSIIPILNKQNKVYRILVITRDITEEVNAKQELEVNRKRLQKAELIASLGHIEYDCENGIYHWSEGAYLIFNAPFNSRKLNTEDFRNLIHPEDRVMVFEAIDRAIKDCTKFEKVYRIKDYEGNEKVIHATGQVQIDSNGNMGNFFGIIQDITMLYNMNTKLYVEEEKFRILAENSPVGIGLYIDEKPVYANDSFLEMVEIDSFSTLFKIDLLFDLVLPEDRNKVFFIAQALKREDTISTPYKITLRKQPKNSTTIQHFDIFLSSFSVNRIRYIQFIVVNITENYENEKIRQQLTTSALHIEKNQKFTDEIENTIKTIIENNPKINLNDLKPILDLIKIHSLSDKDWELLNTLMENIHPQFVARLKEICPSLSAHEIKHCACIRLNFETKEIARFFNVKPESIQTARRRLKRKLNLSVSNDLREFILNV